MVFENDSGARFKLTEPYGNANWAPTSWKCVCVKEDNKQYWSKGEMYIASNPDPNRRNSWRQVKDHEIIFEIL